MSFRNMALLALLADMVLAQSNYRLCVIFMPNFLAFGWFDLRVFHYANIVFLVKNKRLISFFIILKFLLLIFIIDLFLS
mgnify:CR=1 FL=1